MLKKVLLALAVLALPFAAHAAPKRDRRIVVFGQGTSVQSQLKIVTDLGLNVVRQLELIDALVVTAPLGTLEDVRSKLLALPQVVRVDEDLYRNWLSADAMPAFPTLDAFQGSLKEAPAAVLPAELQPEDPASGQGQETPWGIARVRAPQAWGRNAGAGVTVAVIDTGVDGSHPDIAPNFKGGYNAIDPSKPMIDDHGHGTHVAGTVAAANDQQGVVGVAPSAGIVGVKVLDANGSGYISDIIAGIDWVAAQGIPVINMSLGGPSGNDSFHEAIKKAYAKGVTIVCAAGNSGGSVGYPAAYPESIAVSASDSADKLASFSSRGPQVAVIAPGVKVKSTLPGGGYGAMSGTSMASPHMAGLAAIAVASGAQGPAAVLAALKAAASPLPGLTRDQQGAGMVDAAKLAR